MKIKWKLQISALFSFLTLLAVGIMFYFSSRAMDRRIHDKQAIDHFAHGAYELNLVTQNYFIFKEEVSLTQGDLKIQSLELSLKTIPSHNSKEEMLLKKIYGSLRTVKLLFAELELNHHKRPNLSKEEPLFLEWDRSLSGQLSTNLEYITYLSTRLSSMNDDDLESNQHQIWFWGMLFIALLCMLTALISFLTGKSIVQPLENLNRGVEAIGAGALHHHVANGGTDEIGSLITTFNAMSERLSISHHNLKSEIEEHKRSKERLILSLEEKETLVREVFHRSQNTMQIICAMLSLQSQNSPDPELHQSFLEMENRIKSMALAHQKLYQSRSLTRIDCKEYLEELLESLASTYAKDSSPPTMNLLVEEDMFLKIDTAIPFGLIARELISNSLRHAFPEATDKGELHVELSHEAEKIDFRVRDNGVGLSTDFNLAEQKTLGLRVVKFITEYQLKGRFYFLSEGGAEFRVAFEEPKYIERIKE